MKSNAADGDKMTECENPNKKKEEGEKIKYKREGETEINTSDTAETSRI